jgi:hypothetical protein
MAEKIAFMRVAQPATATHLRILEPNDRVQIKDSINVVSGAYDGFDQTQKQKRSAQHGERIN